MSPPPTEILEYLKGQHPTTALQRASLRRFWACAYAVDECEMSYGELGELLGVSRQRASMMAHKGRELAPKMAALLRVEYEVWCEHPDDRVDIVAAGHLESEKPRPRKKRGT